MSQFIFLEPLKTALNKWEVDTIITQRRAFNIVQTAGLNPIWKTTNELLKVTEADLKKIYVLYEFVGDVYGHLSELKCRVIGPLVVLQSHEYCLDFPMRTMPTWSQSLNRKIVTGISFNVDDETDIRDKVILLGGTFSGRISQETTIIIVGVYNPDDLWVQESIDRGILILKKGWLDKMYESSNKLQKNSEKFFDDDCLTQNRIFASPSIEDPIDCPIQHTILAPLTMEASEHNSNITIEENIITEENLIADDDFAAHLFQNSMQNTVQLSPIRPISTNTPRNDENEQPRLNTPYNVPLNANTFNTTLTTTLQNHKDRILQPNTSTNFPPSLNRPVDFLYPNKKRIPMDLRKMGLNATNYSLNTQDSFMGDESIDNRITNAFAKHAHLPKDIQQPFGALSDQDIQPKQVFKPRSKEEFDSHQYDPFLPERKPRRCPKRKSGDTSNHSSITSIYPRDSVSSADKSRIISTARSSSPEYVSQGPVMTVSNSSASNHIQPVIWNDANERTSQMTSTYLRHSTLDGMSQYASGDSVSHSVQNDIFMDEEEKELLAKLVNN